MYPPTMKNTGMTCNTHVSNHIPRVVPIGFVADTDVSSRYTRLNTQCHTTTTSNDPARSRSTYKSRGADGSAADGTVRGSTAMAAVSRR